MQELKDLRVSSTATAKLIVPAITNPSPQENLSQKLKSLNITTIKEKKLFQLVYSLSKLSPEVTVGIVKFLDPITRVYLSQIALSSEKGSLGEYIAYHVQLFWKEQLKKYFPMTFDMLSTKENDKNPIDWFKTFKETYVKTYGSAKNGIKGLEELLPSSKPVEIAIQNIIKSEEQSRGQKVKAFFSSPFAPEIWDKFKKIAYYANIFRIFYDENLLKQFYTTMSKEKMLKAYSSSALAIACYQNDILLDTLNDPDYSIAEIKYYNSFEIRIALAVKNYEALKMIVQAGDILLSYPARWDGARDHRKERPLLIEDVGEQTWTFFTLLSYAVAKRDLAAVKILALQEMSESKDIPNMSLALHQSMAMYRRRDQKKDKENFRSALTLAKELGEEEIHGWIVFLRGANAIIKKINALKLEYSKAEKDKENISSHSPTKGAGLFDPAKRPSLTETIEKLEAARLSLNNLMDSDKTISALIEELENLVKIDFPLTEDKSLTEISNHISALSEALRKGENINIPVDKTRKEDEVGEAPNTSSSFSW